MPRTSPAAALAKVLDRSPRPIYVVDSRRRIVYCNAPLARWLNLEPQQVIGRLVEYHSEGAGRRAGPRTADAPLTDLCPAPRALSGESCTGTISCVARDGRLVHREAAFVPLDEPFERPASGEAPAKRPTPNRSVLVLLAGADMSPEEVAAELSAEPAADELHRTIRRFRRSEAGVYRLDSLLGQSTAMRKVRAQVAAAAKSGSNALVYGPPGSGRRHIARAIHYQADVQHSTKLIALDCQLINDDLFGRAFDALRPAANMDSRLRPTLLLENLESLSPAHQSKLMSALRQNAISAWILGTVDGRGIDVAAKLPAGTGSQSRSADVTADCLPIPPAFCDSELLNEISTISIRIPPLVERLEDLPLLAQFFLEECNRGSGKQIGSIHPEALDRLALHSWPGELQELREVIAAAHDSCAGTEIGPSHLPAVIHHATRAAAHARRPMPQRIVLDELLARIEREAIVRALAQAGGNKTDAAELLGMTRPRLYRRLVQLGLVQESPFDTAKELPEFVEYDSTDESS